MRSEDQIRKYDIRSMKSIPIANPRNDQMSWEQKKEQITARGDRGSELGGYGVWSLGHSDRYHYHHHHHFVSQTQKLSR